MKYEDAVRDFTLAQLLETIHFPPNWIAGGILNESRAGIVFLRVVVRPNLWHALTSKIPDDPVHRGTFLQAICRLFRVSRPDGGAFPDLFMTSGIADAERVANNLVSTRQALLSRS